MDFWQRMQSSLNQGLELSRDLFDKAKDKALDLGEKGMLAVEIKQLEMSLEKLTCKLGARTYQILSETPAGTVSSGIPEIADLLQQMRETETRIREREALLKNEK